MVDYEFQARRIGRMSDYIDRRTATLGLHMACLEQQARELRRDAENMRRVVIGGSVDSPARMAEDTERLLTVTQKAKTRKDARRQTVRQARPVPRLRPRVRIPDPVPGCARMPRRCHVEEHRHQLRQAKKPQLRPPRRRTRGRHLPQTRPHPIRHPRTRQAPAHQRRQLP